MKMLSVLTMAVAVGALATLAACTDGGKKKSDTEGNVVPPQTAGAMVTGTNRTYGCEWSAPVDTKELQKQGDIVAVCNKLRPGKPYIVGYRIVAPQNSQIDFRKDQIAFRITAPGVDKDVTAKFRQVESRVFGVEDTVQQWVIAPSDGSLLTSIGSLRCLDGASQPFDCLLDLSVRVSIVH